MQFDQADVAKVAIDSGTGVCACPLRASRQMPHTKRSRPDFHTRGAYRSRRGALLAPFDGFLEIALQCAHVAASDDFIQSLGACIGMVLENELLDSKATIDTGSLYGEIVLGFVGIFDEEGCLREHKLGADFRSVRLLV